MGFLCLLFAMMSPAGAEGDAIDELLERLSKTSGLWINGVSPILESPKDASHAEVVAEMFTKISFDEGRVNEHTIVEKRKVTIPSGGLDQYIATIVDTNLGRKIVLLQYQQSAGWWTRIY
jgi:hypothetical protein